MATFLFIELKLKQKHHPFYLNIEGNFVSSWGVQQHNDTKGDGLERIHAYGMTLNATLFRLYVQHVFNNERLLKIKIAPGSRIKPSMRGGGYSARYWIVNETAKELTEETLVEESATLEMPLFDTSDDVSELVAPA